MSDTKRQFSVTKSLHLKNWTELKCWFIRILERKVHNPVSPRKQKNRSSKSLNFNNSGTFLFGGTPSFILHPFLWCHFLPFRIPSGERVPKVRIYNKDDNLMYQTRIFPVSAGGVDKERPFLWQHGGEGYAATGCGTGGRWGWNVHTIPTMQT